MGNTKKYWTGVDELLQTEAHQEAISNEFVKDQSIDEFLGDERLKESSTGRRDFLKFMGFSIGAATLAACEAPVIKSIPYVNKPDDIVPGVANYYASTYYDGHDYAGVMVKTREGRPIFIKGNKDFGVAGGAVNARINSSILGLYDSARLKGPKKDGANCSWDDLDAAVNAGLSAANGNVTILSGTVVSPSTHRAIEEFKAAHGANHVQYDARSYSGVRKAHESSHGNAAVPLYMFDEAKVIASFGCDFLGSYMVSNIFANAYGSRRKPEGEWMSKHYQFEANMSLTGSNADVRIPLTPSQESLAIAALHAAIVGGSTVSISEAGDAAIAKAATDLKSAGANALVISGSNDPNVQMLVNAINSSLGAYGTTLSIDTPANFYQGDDAAMSKLVTDMNAGQVKALVIYGCNPSYDWHDAEGFNAGLVKVATTISTNLFADETGSKCKLLAPDCHALESWNDLNPFGPRIDMVQPTISPLFDSRQTQESLLKWSGNSTDYYTYLRQTYNSEYSEALMPTDSAWHTAIHNGTMMAPKPPALPVNTAADAESPLQVDAALAVSAVKSAYKGGGTELSLYSSVAIGNGAQGANPWLQELPDPITKVTWDNYIAMSPMDMAEGFNGTTYRHTMGQNESFDVATVSVNGGSVTLPVFPVPGQKRGTISIALGYGRGAGQEEVGKAAFQTGEYGAHLTDDNGNKVPIGANAFGLASMIDGCVVYTAANVDVAQTGADYQVATTQMHNTIMGRDSIVRETTLAAYMAEKGAAKGEASWNEVHKLAVHGSTEGQPTRDFDMWKKHPVEDIGHRWGMAIDLNSCIGCGSCVTACHVENNVPVVGKDEVLRHRDMHWMRIDRFFASDYPTHKETKEKKGIGAYDAYQDMEHAAENPETVHMPMMCQHCNHAPCETVCPVAATTHSNEGLNQMTYNRCIGTRYCANNCPYKVRRFNWFNYAGYKKFKFQNPAQDELTRMVLNPDVVVRSRGVMEKCSMCVQRIQTGKFDAKKEGRPVKDGEIQTACAEACPTHAITFGDHNDQSSAVRSEGDNNRSYHALEEVGVQPNIFYMTKVRNNNEA